MEDKTKKIFKSNCEENIIIRNFKFSKDSIKILPNTKINYHFSA